MAESFGARLKHAWNVFTNRKREFTYEDVGVSYGSRPDRIRVTPFSNERHLISSIYNRIAIDVAAVTIRHVKLDDQGRYSEDIKSGLNECLMVRANIDQTGRQFRQDIAMSLLESGVIAIVAVETDISLIDSGSFDIRNMRCGPVVEWFPKHVRVRLYDERDGEKKEVLIPKDKCAIVENPLYAVMNEPNSTFQRLVRKYALLDDSDVRNAAGKLDIIIQLPYTVRSETRQAHAEKRRKDIEMQLTSSAYGIAYADATEKITQLNRPVENNLLAQIEKLKVDVYGQLGLSEGIFLGTAEESEQINYYNRTIEPILAAVTDAMFSVFLTKTARTQGQSVMYFRDPFKLVPLEQIAEMADKMTRNEIMSSNEIRGIMGLRPSKDPKADKLVNSNLNQAEAPPEQGEEEVTEETTDPPPMKE